MAALHEALQTLAPVEHSTLPLDDLRPYMEDAFCRSQMLIDSVPPPSDDVATPSTGRSRANTGTSGVSLASSASEISASSARSAPANTEHAQLQKEWGKPIKLSAKENPLGICVYKLAGKDGKGAWFARRSVHEGLGFKRWKKGLEREFPESLEVQGGPGEGNIRGIGGERIVDSKEVSGVGKMQVYHLSAQFPGPTTPRDFVTLLLTSSAALPASRAWASESNLSSPLLAQRKPQPPPRHYTVISKPCIHQDCPPREGFIRGEYESIEFIREVPVKPPPTPRRSRANSFNAAKEAMVRNAQNSTKESALSASGLHRADSQGRQRGKTISFVEGAGGHAKTDGLGDSNGRLSHDEDAETNPVEWIMITRSDPGGSVPRWMVERGTPAGIVADATKFLDWACKKEHPESEDEDEENHADESPEEAFERRHSKDLHAVDTNGHLTGLDGKVESQAEAPKEPMETAADVAPPTDGGFLSKVGAGLSAITPTVIADHLPGQHVEGSPTIPQITRSPSPSPSISSSSTASLASFATASPGNISASEETSSPLPPGSASSLAPPNPTEKELGKLKARKQRLDEALARTRASTTLSTTSASAKEAAALAKAEEKHAREVAKHEERYKKEVAKIEARRARDARRAQERKRKEDDRDERARWKREAEDLRREVEVLKQEREALKGVVGELQRENTGLVMKLGNLVDGGAGAKEGDGSIKSVKSFKSIKSTPGRTATEGSGNSVMSANSAKSVKSLTPVTTGAGMT
ncbi:MAG: hypothetical protein M1832_003217 [Thelocarpon impressellum]|nr:MAG: hypothetical protein M1832_003217 [Thelocarpon impressellum]